VTRQPTREDVADPVRAEVKGGDADGCHAPCSRHGGELGQQARDAGAEG
jgi:hypothetical protein